MTAINLSSQQALDVDPKATKEINGITEITGKQNFTGILLFYIIKEAKKKLFFFAGKCESIINLF